MSYLMFVSVDYGDADSEEYLVPLSIATGERADTIEREHSDALLARLEGIPDTKALIYAAGFDRGFSDALLKAIVRRRRIKDGAGELVGSHTRAFRSAWSQVRSNLEPYPQQGDQYFTVIKFGDDFMLKLYRRLEPGINPGREVPEFLTEQTTFTAIPRALGSLEYRRVSDDLVRETTIGTLSSFIHNGTSGWIYTVDQLSLFFEHALAIPADDPRVRDLPLLDPMSSTKAPVPTVIARVAGQLRGFACAAWRVAPQKCIRRSAAGPTFLILHPSRSPSFIATASITEC